METSDGGGEDDDAWIEAELERELMAMGSVEDSESDREDDAQRTWITGVAVESSTNAVETVDASQAAEVHELPESFQELMRCLEELEADAAETTEKTAAEARQDAQELEDNLRAPRPAWQAEDFLLNVAPVATSSAVIDSVLADVEAELDATDESGEDAVEVSPRAAPSALDEKALIEEAMAEAFGKPRQGWGETEEQDSKDAEDTERTVNERGEDGEGLEVNSVASEEDKVGESCGYPKDEPTGQHADVPVGPLTKSAEAPDRPKAEGMPVPKGVTVEEATPPDSALDDMQHGIMVEAESLRSFDEEQRRLEAESASLIAKFEKEQQELRARLLREEDYRKEEEVRAREESAMQSEEIRTREVIYAERSMERRERRDMAWEDRRGKQVRKEEKLARDNEERGREASERTAMSKEDALAHNLRRRDWEARETRAMSKEDSLSYRFNAEMRRREEVQRFAIADKESRRWQERAREIQECQRMAAEDAHSDFVRQCCVPIVKHTGAAKSASIDPTGAGVGVVERTRHGAAAAAAVAMAAAGIPLNRRSPSACQQVTGQSFASAHVASTGVPLSGRAAPQMATSSTATPNAAASALAALTRPPPTRAAADATPRAAAPSPSRDAARPSSRHRAPSRSGRPRSASRRVDAGETSINSLSDSGVDSHIQTAGFPPCRVIDPWSSISWPDAEPNPQQEVTTKSRGDSRQGRSAGAASREGGAGGWTVSGATDCVEEPVSRCTGLLCEALKKDAVKWRGRSPPSWRQPPISSPEPSAAVRHSSAPSTAQDAAVFVEVSAELMSMLGIDEALMMDSTSSSLRRVARLETKMEDLDTVPDLRCLPALRVLGLTSNRLTDLSPLRHCTLLEELSLCQQQQKSLTKLDGLENLSRLVVLKATQNAITSTQAISNLRALRVVELRGNKLSDVRLGSPGLAKLDLYRNELTSASFLEHLPSLTHLDLGRNRLRNIDARISEWNPLLLKLFLHQNRLTCLPELRLPLLTDLGVDNNELNVLGPMGFLPSLERLSAEYNQIQELVSPIASSPLLRTLSVVGNRLDSVASLLPIFTYSRLQKLRLNDNPIVAELMERYRPWVLQRAPQIEELDNEVLGEEERLSAAVARAYKSTNFAYDLLGSGAGGFSISSRAPWCPALPQQRTYFPTRQATAVGGLLGLVAPDRGSDAESMDVSEVLGGVERGPASGSTDHASVSRLATNAKQNDCVLSGVDVLEIQRSALLARWCAGMHPEDGGRHGCDMCGLALWCESCTAMRGALLVGYARDERRAAQIPRPIAGDHGYSEVLYTLRRRREFWNHFLDACGAHHASLSPWGSEASQTVCRVAAYESFGTERSRVHLALRLQARWRGIAARRRCAGMRFQRRCSLLTKPQRQSVVRVQAFWRGRAARRELVARGMQLPGARRRMERLASAATRLQAIVRGSRARGFARRLRRAQRLEEEIAKMVEEEMADCPEVDMDDILGGVANLEAQNPWTALHVPAVGPPLGSQALSSVSTGGQAIMSARQPQPSGGSMGALSVRSPSGTATAENASPTALATPGGPRAAWSTPPATAQGFSGQMLAPASEIASSPRGSSCSSRPGTGNGVVRRCRSLSSTAESAVVESEGLLKGASRVEQVKNEWGFENESTAQALLLRQNKMRFGTAKPPKPPVARVAAPSGQSTSHRNNAARAVGSSRNTHSQPAGRGGPGGSRCVKAQDGIAEFRRQQEEEHRASQATSPAGIGSEAMLTREFSTGEPNKILLRSSLSGRSSPSTPPGIGSSPRARSPLRNGFMR